MPSSLYYLLAFWGSYITTDTLSTFIGQNPFELKRYHLLLSSTRSRQMPQVLSNFTEIYYWSQDKSVNSYFLSLSSLWILICGQKARGYLWTAKDEEKRFTHGFTGQKSRQLYGIGEQPLFYSSIHSFLYPSNISGVSAMCWSKVCSRLPKQDDSCPHGAHNLLNRRSREI